MAVLWIKSRNFILTYTSFVSFSYPMFLCVSLLLTVLLQRVFPLQLCRKSLHSFITIKLSFQRAREKSVFFLLSDNNCQLIEQQPPQLSCLHSVQIGFSNEPCAIFIFTFQGWANGLSKILEFRLHLLEDERFAIIKDHAELTYYGSFWRHFRWGLNLLTTFTIAHETLLLHSWQLLVLSWETWYEMLPAKPLKSFIYAVVTPI